ncbi:hypothetical protein PENTCL1PPCAC_6180, partial [Pristionchus entomophagus]
FFINREWIISRRVSLRCRLYLLFQSTSWERFPPVSTRILPIISTLLRMLLVSPSHPRELTMAASLSLLRSMTDLLQSIVFDLLYIIRERL